MGAAAFLMVEYVGIPYSDIVKHAFLPAILSYIGLFYIVHLEALKLGMQPIVKRTPTPLRDRVMRNALGVTGTVVLVCALYYLILGFKAVLGPAAPYAVGALVLALYLVAVWQAASAGDISSTIRHQIRMPMGMMKCRPARTVGQVCSGLGLSMSMSVARSGQLAACHTATR